MRFRAVGLVLVLSAAVVAAAQPAPSVPELPATPDSPETSPRIEGDGLATPETQTRFRPAAEVAPRVATTQVTFGMSESLPNISATLGTSDSTSAFTVFGWNLPRFVITGEGRVGIGTTTPAEAVDVVRDAPGATVMRVRNSDAGTATAASSTALHFAEGTTLKAHITSANSASSSLTGGAGVLQVWNRLNAPTIFGTNNSERMRIFGNGNVGIGSATDGGATLYVRHSATGGYGAFISADESTTADATRHDYGLLVYQLQNVAAGVANGGTVHAAVMRGELTGPGTLYATYGARFQSGIASGATGSVNTAMGAWIQVGRGAGTVGTGYGIYMPDVEATNDYGMYQAGVSDDNYFAGSVGIGTATPTHKLHVIGDAHVQGTLTGTNVRATYQDIAEWVPVTTALAPGTVVVLNPDRTNEVMASSEAYDIRVAGVVSAQPGLSLGVEGEGKAQIATTGRVKVRVDAREAPIKVGDLLVTSSVEGAAMRSEAMEINGRRFHQPGTIIGKALEPLQSGIGEVLVLLSMQ